MIVYGSIKVKVITYATVLVTSGTILLCYTLAVILGHVPAWLPMISDCAVEPPEKYLFRLGIIPGAVALFANVIMVYYAFPDFQLRNLELLTGALASAGLALLTAVNEDEDNTIHTAGAILCFVGYFAYMGIVAYNAPNDPKISSSSAISKRIFVISGIILLIAAGLFSNTA